MQQFKRDESLFCSGCGQYLEVHFDDTPPGDDCPMAAKHELEPGDYRHDDHAKTWEKYEDDNDGR